MNRTVLLFVFVSNIWTVVSGQEVPKSITIPKINRDIVVDGRAEKKEWISIDSIAGFSCFSPQKLQKIDSSVILLTHLEQYISNSFGVVSL